MFDSGVSPAILDDLGRQLDAGATLTFEAFHVRKDKTRFPVEIRIRTINDARLAIVRDLTARRALEDQLRQKQKMEAIGLLAGGIAHDFNNILMITSGMGEELLEDQGIDASRRDCVIAIMEASNRAASLTAQLLAFGRRTIIAPKPIDLNDAVNNIGRMIRRLIGEDMMFETNLATSLPAIFGDAGQIDQVLLNLVLNARDAMPDGGRITIATSEQMFDDEHTAPTPRLAPGKYVGLCVADTGEGIEEDDQARIFEPFFTTKGPGRGTGLGLATVYGIVEQGRGHISVASKLGGGTTFTVLFPAISAAQRTSSPEVAKAIAGDDHPRATERILLVEDEADVRRIVRRILERFGYAVMEASDGPSALNLLAAQPASSVHLLLTDIVMPHMNGRELADVVTNLNPQIKVLFMSGYTDDAIVRGHNETRMAERVLLQKPFSSALLLEKIREILGNNTRPLRAR